MSVTDDRSTQATSATRDAGDVSTDPAGIGLRVGASDDGPVTGPLPVVDLVDGHVHVAARRDVTILSVDGGLDDDLAEQVLPAVRDAVRGATAVLLDLDQATLLDQSALTAVVDALPVADPDVATCIVAGRLSGRLVLERWNLLDEVVVFSSIADALQARTFAESGYGTGWQSD